MKRRSMLLLGAGALGALVVGWGVLPPRSRLGRADKPPAAEGPVGLNGWLKVNPDGTVQLAMNHSEMGQGVHTALAMLVAEELDISLAKIKLVQAVPDKIYGNVAMFVASLPLHPHDSEPGRETGGVKTGRWIVSKVARELGISVTGGSSSVADAWGVLRLAAATARAQLLGAASLQWKLPREELQIVDGVVSHPSAKQGAHFGELARVAAATPVGEVKLKDAKAWRLIGTGAPRTDLPAKVDGSAKFGIDTRLPEQVYAVIRHSPVLGGGPGRVDSDAAMKLPGVERVVRLGPYAGSTAAVAVVGRTYWHAKQGAQALDIEWRAPPAGTADSQQIARALEAAAREAAASQGGFTFHRAGDVTAASAAAARRIEAVYHAPYLAHAAMEPINCTARVKDGRVEVWAPTQVPDMARAEAARVAGVSVGAVTLHVTYLGGGFGRRLEVDFVGQAVRIALETNGRPVQLVWPREEDTTHDFYRPAGAAVMQASIDAQGVVTGLSITSAGDMITPRWLERGLPALAGPLDMPDKTASEGLFDLPYAIANQRIAHVATRSGVPVGFWRSVGHSHNAFFSEGFIDELAVELKQDPVAFRLSLLADMPRYAAVLKLAASKAGWGQPLPAGVARGVALHESFGSIVAQVAEVSLLDGKPRVHRVVCAADIGTVVNPGIVAQQMESAVIFGLSAALYGRVDIVGGVVQQTNFPNYPVLKLADSPRIETHLIASLNPPGGVGEPGTPPIAPAVANALFVLTGKRVRALPLVV
ncbi:MAG: xanthine dehydrogenase family protein molybdopterin-binding subunit [Cytophagales bacterium]|nr:xanthine dehydrogenase family protein molybdopterin-binding subunit [Rhizobacter sp.]